MPQKPAARHRAADQRDDQAFGEQLSNDAPATRAQSRPQGDLLVTSIARASIRFAMFAHAISNTKPTKPIVTQIGLSGATIVHSE